MPQVTVSDNGSDLTLQTTTNETTVQENVVSLEVNETSLGLEVTRITHSVEVREAGNDVSVTESPIELTVAEGLPGPAGPQGPEASYTIDTVAGEALGGHRAVVIQNGEAFYASSSTLSHASQVVGITTHAASAAADIEVQFAGELEHATWAWSPGALYIGPNGTLTQTRPSSGWIMNIGVALTATKILIHRTVSIEVA